MISLIVRYRDGQEIHYVIKREHLLFLIRNGYDVAIPYNQILIEDVEKLSAAGIVVEADADSQLLRIKKN